MHALTIHPEASRGQVLPIFALFLVVLLGMAALAMDVSGALSARRFYRSAADAASLAGAQDLQQASGRSVSNTERTRARTDALATLATLMGIGIPTCDPTLDIVDCALTGTGLVATIKTPSPTCVTCDPERSVQVTVRNPTFALGFGRLFGQNSWNVASTSVAGLTFSKSYAIQTLRPPKRTGSTFDVKDITLEGNGTRVVVSTGDVGTNSNMNYSGSGAILQLDSGYDVWFFDPSGIPTWSPTPPGRRLFTLMTDPNYRYPSMINTSGGASAPTFGDARENQKNVAGKPVTTADVNAACLAEWNKVDATRYANIATTPLGNVYCYEPGIYDPAAGHRSDDAQIAIGTGHVGLLKPGAYYLKGGLNVGGSVLGGYEPNAPGVALMFDECNNQCTFNGNNAFVVAINAGTKFPPTYAGGIAARPAIDWDGQQVVTSGPNSPDPPILISILVKKDPNCFVPTSPPFQEPAACDAQHDTTTNVAGGGGLVLEGVQYMPTDNVQISGNATSNGRIGQIVAWTLKYSGGTRINQEGAANEGPGILRLDAGCTAPSTPCNSP
jgi:Flp pilus assembly protein TadG